MLPLKWRKGRQPRRLLCFSAAFFVTALLFSLLFSRCSDLADAALLTGAAAFGLAAALVALLREDYGLFLPLLAGLLAGWLWCCGYSWLIWQPAQAYGGRNGMIRLELTEYAESHDSYGSAYGVVSSIDGDPCRLKVRAYLLDGSPDYAPGDVLVFRGELRAAEKDWRGNLLQEGIFLTVSQTENETVYPCGAMTLLRRARILSRTVTEQAGKLLPGDEGALLAALLSGDRSGFSRELDRALTVSGTRHITAVSGLHVSVLAGILMGLLGKKAGLLVSVPVSVAYAAVAGFSPSVVRAVVLLVFWAAAFWLRLEKDSLTAFGAALLLLLLWNPFSCLSVGLLLSFSATLGLILLSAPLNEVLTRRIKQLRPSGLKKLLWYAAGTVSSTLAATLFTLPWNILFFDIVPLLSLLSNLLILWALSLTMLLGIAVLSLSPVLPSAAVFLARWVLRWPLLWMVSAVKWVGSLRFAATDSGNRLLLAACLVLIAAALLWRGKVLSGKKLLFLTAAAICVTGIVTAGGRMLFGTVEIRNAGGQPVILLRSEGVSLINSGARPGMAADTVQSALSRWNADALETVLCTTGDYKSQSGLPAVLAQTDIERVLLPSDSGSVSSAYAGQPVLAYSRTGTVTVSGVTAQLFRGGEEAFALRLLGKRFSLLSLCGVKAEDALAVVEHNECGADILLVDDRICDDWGILYEICRTVEPSRLLIVSNGYSEYGESFSGIPVTLVDWEGIRFRFVR